ncbi:MAG: hypothetical protein LBO62_01640 [Endomicrobium sp.]|jgi:hypothetical protein|nr:hypothetical protein [Endomicrobium sp.]
MEEQKRDAESPPPQENGDNDYDLAKKSEKIDKVYDVEGVIFGAIAGGVVGFIVSFEIIFAIQIGAFVGLVVGTRIKKENKDDSPFR